MQSSWKNTYYDHIKTKKHQKNLENQQCNTLIERFVKL